MSAFRDRFLRRALLAGALLTGAGLALPAGGRAAGQGVPRAVPESVPPAVPAPTPAATPAGADLSADAVEDLVHRYRLAFSARDAQAAKAVWPAVDERGLARAFGQLETQELTFAECQADVQSSTRATATCRGSLRFVPRVGAGGPQVQLRRWDFVLIRFAGDWRIASVESTESVPPVTRYPESPANSAIRPPR